MHCWHELNRGCWRARLVIAVVGIATFASANVTDAQERVVLGRGDSSASMSAFDGRVVWNARARGGFVLMTYAGGRTRRVPIARRRLRAYDVDLGPHPSGRTVAIYSRCRSERRQRDCDLYIYDFERAEERRLRGPSRGRQLLREPSIWRGRLAYVRGRARPGSAAARQPRLVFSTLGGNRVRTYRGGTRSVPGEPGLPPDIEDFTDVDLRGTRIAFSWWFQPLRCPLASGRRADAFDTAQEIWVVRLGRARALAAEGCTQDARPPSGPVVLGASGLSVGFSLRGQFADPGRGTLDARVGELPYGGGPVALSTQPVLGTFARDGDYTYFFDGGSAGRERLVRERLEYRPADR
jgi:hypothetical protein